MCQHLSNIVDEAEGYYFLSDAKRKDLPIVIDLDKIYDAVTSNVQSGEKNSKPQDKAIIQDQYSQLRQAVQEGYGKLITKVEYGGTNFSMLKNLQTNVAVFSAFKKHDMMKELVKQLKDENGKQKSKQQFVQDAKKLVNNYREQFLRNEYDAAVRGSRMATVWEQIQRSRNLYPNIEYTISRSANKREEHLDWVGTVLPVDHPWWSIHFPPNGFGCKCGARPTDKQPTDAPSTGDVHPAFAFNPGKDGQVFDVEKHPYAQLPQKEYRQAAREAWSALCNYEYKSLVKDFRDGKVMNKPVKAPGIPEPVQFNRISITKNLEHNAYFFEKLNLLNNIESMIEDSSVILVENRKPKQHVKQYHILQHTTESGQRINIHVEERKDGSCWLYYIHIQK
jgi:hypothetical protein